MITVFIIISVKVSLLNPLSVNPTKWSNTLKQFVSNLPANYLSVFDHLVGLVLKGLISNVYLLLTALMQISRMTFGKICSDLVNLIYS